MRWTPRGLTAALLLAAASALTAAFAGATAATPASAATANTSARLLVVSVCREQRVAAQLSGATEVASAANPVNYVEVDGHAVAYETGAGGGPADVCKLSPGTVYCFLQSEQGVKPGDPWAEAIVLGAPGLAKAAAIVAVKAGAKPTATAVASSAKSVAVGAKGLLCKILCSNAAKALTTGADEAIFWSGVPGGAGTASRWAGTNGGVTLESTLASRGISLPAYDSSSPISVAAWRAASKQFASGARGSVRVLQDDSVRVRSIWAQIEYPALRANARVSSITAINPRTGAKTVLWSR
jgi:hypothetical protein